MDFALCTLNVWYAEFLDLRAWAGRRACLVAGVRELALGARAALDAVKQKCINLRSNVVLARWCVRLTRY